MVDKTIIINSEKLETRVAFLNGDVLEEFYVDRENKKDIVGSIFYGRVENIEYSLKAVFVDIGMEKNAFMHFHDMLPASYDDTDRCNRKMDSKRHIKEDDIPKIFPVGSYLFVQVTKGPIGNKGPRATTNISLPGRYLVLLPFSDHIGISKKIEDPEERERLNRILSKLKLPKGMGCICRTIGEDKKSIFFKRDLKMLLEYWRDIEDRAKREKRPRLVYKELSLIEKSMRDFLTEDISAVIIDDEDAFTYIKRFIYKAISRTLAKRIKLYKKAAPIFEYYGIDKQIEKIFNRKVYLPSGGYICIDETEALIAIDVNSGSSRYSAMNRDKFILNTNMEAAKEVAKQLRLRNIGGLIVVDFIDMKNIVDNEKLYKYMKELLKEDRARTRILPISSLGLMQMTRQRERESLLDRIFSPCPYCGGNGRVKSPLSISVEIQRVLKEIFKRKVWDKDLEVRVIMHPVVFARLKNEDSIFLQEIEDKYGRDISFRSDSSIHIEEFRIINPKIEEDLLEYTSLN